MWGVGYVVVGFIAIGHAYGRYGAEGVEAGCVACWSVSVVVNFHC